MGVTIFELIGLNQVTSIGSNLSIGDWTYYFGGNPMLTDLSGLENVTSVEEGLRIINNPANQSYWTGQFNIHWGGLNYGVIHRQYNLSGLYNVTSIGENLYISDNSVASLTGLDNVTTIGVALNYGIILHYPAYPDCTT
ncbi:MAG: hypothetical protein R2764_10170 [Bacteroidales bacterium]